MTIIYIPTIIVIPLRNWVYLHTVIGEKSAPKADKTYGKDIVWIYNYYQQKLGGARCNNIAYFFRSILDRLGYISFEYHFGKIGGFNHVVNLIRVSQKGRDIFTVQDAYYNMSFYDKRGDLLDFFTMLKLIKENRTKDIIVKNSSSTPRNYLFNLKDGVEEQLLKRSKALHQNDTRIVLTPTIMDDMELYYSMFIVPRHLFGNKLYISTQRKRFLDKLFDTLKKVINN